MRVVEEGPDRLVLENRPVVLRVMCVGLFLLFLVLSFGAGLFPPGLMRLMGMPEEGIAALPRMPGSLIGYASVIPLFAAVFLVSTRRLTLDRPSGQVTIAAREVLGGGETRFPLADLEGASLAASRSNNSSTTYRAVLQFRSAGDVPLTPYSTSGPGPSQTVDRINGWLGAQPGMSGAEAATVAAVMRDVGIPWPGGDTRS